MKSWLPLLLIAALIHGCSSDPSEDARYGYFIDQPGEYVIVKDSTSLHVHEVEPGRINYRVLLVCANNGGEGSANWGPAEAPIASEEDWFFYVESKRRIWLSHGERLILLKWDEAESGTYGVLESCAGGPDWCLVKKIPDPVCRRLPESVVAVIAAESTVE